jgi:hypothetical protein
VNSPEAGPVRAQNRNLLPTSKATLLLMGQRLIPPGI